MDASVGHVVEHEHKISGRSNCMEILCRRIDKNNHTSTSNTMEVLVLSAVYASQRNDWKNAFLSLNPANGREKEPTMPFLEQSAASPRDDSVTERNMARLRSLNAALQQARSLNASPAAPAPETPPVVKTPQQDSSQEPYQENVPESGNSVIFKAKDHTPSIEIVQPEALVDESHPEPDSGDEQSSGRVLNLDAMLEEAVGSSSTSELSGSPRVPEPLPTARMSIAESSPEPTLNPDASAQAESSPTEKSSENIDNGATEMRLPMGSTGTSNISQVEDKNERLVQQPSTPFPAIDCSEKLAHKKLRHGIVNDEKVGYLFKRGRGRSITFLKPWSYRWCSLNIQTGRLSYHVEDEDGYVIGIISSVSFHI